MTIRVRKEVSKTRQSRLIPMDKAIAPMLEERAGRVGQEKYIFGDGSDYRKPFSGWGKRFAALAKAMRIERAVDPARHPPNSRHRLMQPGSIRSTIEDLLGHTTGLARASGRRLQPGGNIGSPAAGATTMGDHAGRS